ncbi:MAG: DUF3237 domain-containing protein [Alphaproteobacteria bacterium]|nr:DUF3237 domain-containing protein [Alphaproteobacteria bacterium]
MAGIGSELLFTLDLTVAATALMDFGQTPIGHRRVGAVEGGRFQGPKLKGTVMPGGSDWLITRPDGVTRLDVRLALKTDDDAYISMTYFGLRHGPAEELAKMMRGEPIDSSRLYFRTAPFFETGAPKYAWLNSVIAIGIGDRKPAGPHYDVYQVL